jgi:hypothetical protein
MAERRPFLLRVSPELLDALRGWADQEMRSLNGQIEYLLRQAVRVRTRELREQSADDTDQDPTGD